MAGKIAGIYYVDYKINPQGFQKANDNIKELMVMQKVFNQIGFLDKGMGANRKQLGL